MRTKSKVQSAKEVTATGEEWNRFNRDSKYWGEDRWMEDVEIRINGEAHDELSDQILNDLEPTDEVVIVKGVVTTDDEDVEDIKLRQFFLDWRNTQTHIPTLVDVPRERITEFRKLVTDFGAKFVGE